MSWSDKHCYLKVKHGQKYLMRIQAAKMRLMRKTTRHPPTAIVNTFLMVPMT